MPVALLARRFTLLLVVALCPALAYALSETYEGLLMPDSRDAPIPVVVELREAGSILTGNVKASSPLNINAPIESGGNQFGQCNMTVVLNRSVTLRLFGSCEPTMFRGKYAISDSQRRTVSRGSFRLARKAPELVKGNGTDSTITPTNNVATCLKANARCLTACPRGDYNTEFMCANHCRSKLQVCKGKADRLPAAVEQSNPRIE